MEDTHASKEALWLQILCSKIGFKQQAVRLDYDSKVQSSWKRTLLITLK